MCDPAVFLETARLFALPTPMGLFLPSQQPLRQSSKLLALRADVFAKVRARHLGFLLLRRLRLCSLSEIARKCLSSVLGVPATLPHGGATCAFFAPSGYAPGCVRKTGHSRHTRLTRADRRFSAAPVGTLPTAFGCVPAHTLRPALQAFARKTAGWRAEWAGACTKGSHFAFGRPA